MTTEQIYDKSYAQAFYPFTGLFTDFLFFSLQIIYHLLFPNCHPSAGWDDLGCLDPRVREDDRTDPSTALRMTSFVGRQAVAE